MTVESFSRAYRDSYRAILTVAEQRLAGFADAEDVTAEVFRIAWTHAAQGTEITLPWLYQVLRNLLGNQYRRGAREAAFVARFGPMSIESVVEPGTEDAVTVRRALLRLQPDDRELLYMAYWEDLSMDEIAEIIGCAPTTVRVKLLRARRRLKPILVRLELSPQKVGDGQP